MFVFGVSAFVFGLGATSKPVPDQASLSSKGGYTYLDQNWSDQVREAWHTMDQGSLLVPYDWWPALENARGKGLFQDGTGAFGMLPGIQSKDGSLKLPFGLVPGDFDQDYYGIATRKWIGPTCAACHTSVIRYKKPGESTETSFLIDGGQNNLDYGNFRSALLEAVIRTQKDGAKFDRFASRVLGKGGNTSEARAKLRSQFALYTDHMIQEGKTDDPVHPWGPGRMDAFGLIFNRVSALALGIPDNLAITDAPVSTPFIWNLHRQDHMQWHGETVNTRPSDRLGRNAGEVFGNYGVLTIDPSQPMYPSSIKSPNLVKMEDWLDDLQPPKWPGETFGMLDAMLVKRGADLYKQNCASCHAVLSDDPNQVANVTPVPLLAVGTDPNMTVNYHTRIVKTGVLEGLPMFGPDSPKFGATAHMMDVMNHVAVHWDVNEKAGMKSDPYVLMPQDLPGYKDNINNWGYEAKPLNGIWATAPFLHNGSVASLDQLLLPGSQRMKTFYVGTTSYDPVHVGYQTGKSYGGSLFDTSLPGNRNTGHEYGTSLNVDDRKALLEYLKSL